MLAVEDPAQVQWSFGVYQEVPPAPAAGLQPNSVFAGRFRIEELLGAGAMGRVFRAFDQTAERPVAIKLLLDPLNPTAAKRFAREGELTAALSHPGILRVHGGGVTAEGLPFLVLELVDGARNLQRAMEEDPEQALTLLAQVARAVGHAHQSGVVHRDLKPDNILVDGQGRVRVCDFGLAWRRDMDALTKTGHMVGTPAFMAPEVFMGATRGKPIPASDVWSLGVMLYHLLTGVYPFEPNVRLVEFMARVTSGELVNPREHRRDLSPALAAVCLRALEKNPERRFADGDAFADALEAARSAPPVTGPSQVLYVAAGAVAVLGFALGAVLLTRSRGDEPAPPVVTVHGPEPDPAPDYTADLERARREIAQRRFAAALDALDPLPEPDPELVWEAVLGLAEDGLARERFARAAAACARPAARHLSPAQAHDPERRANVASRCVRIALDRGATSFGVIQDQGQWLEIAQAQRDLLTVAVRVAPEGWSPPPQELRQMAQGWVMLLGSQRHSSGTRDDPSVMSWWDTVTAAHSVLLVCSELAPQHTELQQVVAAIEPTLYDDQRAPFTPVLRRAYEVSAEGSDGRRDMRFLLTRQLLRLDPESEEGHALLAECLREEGLAPEARRWLQTLRAERAVKRGELDEAERLLNTMLAEKPEQIRWLSMRAQVRAALGDTARAEEDAWTSLTLPVDTWVTEDWEAILGASNLLWARRDDLRVAARLLKLLRAVPTHAQRKGPLVQLKVVARAAWLELEAGETERPSRWKLKVLTQELLRLPPVRLGRRVEAVRALSEVLEARPISDLELRPALVNVGVHQAED